MGIRDAGMVEMVEVVGYSVEMQDRKLWPREAYIWDDVYGGGQKWQGRHRLIRKLESEIQDERDGG